MSGGDLHMARECVVEVAARRSDGVYHVLLHADNGTVLPMDPLTAYRLADMLKEAADRIMAETPTQPTPAEENIRNA